MQDRGIRRHHIERLKGKRKHYWGYGKPYMVNEEMSPKQLGAVVQHPASCSCFGHGHPRRHLKNAEEARTVQERSYNEAFKKIEFED